MPELPLARPLFPGSLVDVAGLKVGHFTDQRRPTGCSVVICKPARWPASTCAAPRRERARPTCCTR